VIADGWRGMVDGTCHRRDCRRGRSRRRGGPAAAGLPTGRGCFPGSQSPRCDRGWRSSNREPAVIRGCPGRRGDPASPASACSRDCPGTSPATTEPRRTTPSICHPSGSAASALTHAIDRAPSPPLTRAALARRPRVLAVCSTSVLP
jgi:hypothetical protein